MSDYTDGIKKRLEAAKDFTAHRGIPVESDYNSGYMPPIPMEFANFIFLARDDIKNLLAEREVLRDAVLIAIAALDEIPESLYQALEWEPNKDVS